MAAEQDTITDPYAGAPAAKRHWLPEAFFHCYFDFFAGVEVLIEPDLCWFGDDRPFRILWRLSLVTSVDNEAVRCDEAARMSSQRPFFPIQER